MGRPTKQGVDYFPLDVNFDEKTEPYVAENEAVGHSVLIIVWGLIYQNHGYFAVNDKKFHLMVKRRVNVGIEDVKRYIDSMVEHGIFDKSLFEKFGVLTSRGIQARFFKASNKKKEVRYFEDFLLCKIDSGGNLVSDGGNPFFTSSQEESIRKGRGRGKGRGKGRGELSLPITIPKDLELTPEMKDRANAYWGKKGIKANAEDEFFKFTAWHNSVGSKKVDWDATWTTWYSRTRDESSWAKNGNQAKMGSHNWMQTDDPDSWLKRKKPDGTWGPVLMSDLKRYLEKGVEVFYPSGEPYTASQNGKV